MGGNPLPEVFWYKNGVQVNSDYVKHSGFSVNQYSFIVQPSDNNAKFECHVSNKMTRTPKKASVTMRVDCKYFY